MTQRELKLIDPEWIRWDHETRFIPEQKRLAEVLTAHMWIQVAWEGLDAEFVRGELWEGIYGDLRKALESIAEQTSDQATSAALVNIVAQLTPNFEPTQSERDSYRQMVERMTEKSEGLVDGLKTPPELS